MRLPWVQAFLVLGYFLHNTALYSQEVLFDQGAWRTNRIEEQRRSQLIMTNEERIDSMYIENTATGEMDLVVQHYPLARYEYFPDGAIQRRIDIRQELYSTYHPVPMGCYEKITEEMVIDIPNGAYHEFFPNGDIRIKGTLNGYNGDGTLKKMGEWLEWDTTGTVIRRETYP